ncbi:hypothetical protein HYFRA_00011927 [Hymenoscyphus fraxineus]|uniref:Defective in cullin neddylation protein n=1 Tax=Hymenoscyphus fraxineus TaxID=746836 RepID=A0A9N9PR83_9HELO|nr:hypothetical protein HYFRA_00011927 [Hymenoscyphus fraxineus]
MSITAADFEAIPNIILDHRYVYGASLDLALRKRETRYYDQVPYDLRESAIIISDPPPLPTPTAGTLAYGPEIWNNRRWISDQKRERRLEGACSLQAITPKYEEPSWSLRRPAAYRLLKLIGKSLSQFDLSSKHPSAELPQSKSVYTPHKRKVIADVMLLPTSDLEYISPLSNIFPLPLVKEIGRMGTTVGCGIFDGDYDEKPVHPLMTPTKFEGLDDRLSAHLFRPTKKLPCGASRSRHSLQSSDLSVYRVPQRRPRYFRGTNRHTSRETLVYSTRLPTTLPPNLAQIGNPPSDICLSILNGLPPTASDGLIASSDDEVVQGGVQVKEINLDKESHITKVPAFGHAMDSFSKRSTNNANVDLHSYFASNGGAAASVDRSKDNLEKLFNSYRDVNDEEDTVGTDGTMRYLTADLKLNIENAEMLIPLEIVQAPSIGDMTKEGFVNGWKAVGADTIAKQRAYITTQVRQLSTDMTLYKRVYRYVYVCAREKGQKALPVDQAITYWEVLFTHPGMTFTTASTNWTALWFEYLGSWTKTVNKDMWNMTLEFLQKAMGDETLSFWNEDGAWPSVIDDFVAWVKEKRGEGERMETD